MHILGLELVAVGVTMILTLALGAAIFSPGFHYGLKWRGIFVSFGAMFALCGLLLTWLGIRVSQRICGPVYRMKQDLAAIRRDDARRPIHLRKGDAFQELADELNRTIEHLRRER
jgi:nitrogen fixation/metabolism regulation signal transduction histidine kinase